MIRKSTRPIVHIEGIAEIMGTVSRNPQDRRRGGHSTALQM
jgi:hypothetical protein